MAMTPQQAFQRAYGASMKYTEDTVIGMGAIKGDKGDKGDTGAQGIQGEKGDKGDKGDAATIEVGTVSTGTTTSVTNSGTTSNAVFDFILEKGETGDKGDNAQIFTGTYIAADGIYSIATSHVGDIYINIDTNNVYQRTDEIGTLNYWKEVCNIKGAQGDDAYQVAVEEGFIGTKAEWLASLTGEAKGSEIVWEKPDIHGSTIELGKWYYYKVDSGEYGVGVGDAWLNRYEVPKDKDYTNCKYAFYDGIKYLCFASDTAIPALTTKDTHNYYVLYDEKNQRCQGHIIELSTGIDTSLNWYDVTHSLIVPDGYEEVTPGECTQYGKWTQTIYLGSSKESAYDCTISTGTSVSGFISTEAFAQTIGALGDLTTTNKTNIVYSINEVNAKFDNYVDNTDVIDSLTSTSTDKPLSANQGKVLKQAIDDTKSELEQTISNGLAEKLDIEQGASNANKSVKTDENGKIIFVDSADELPFKLGIDADGNYGYIKAGADTVTPFKRKSSFEYLKAGGTESFSITIPNGAKYLITTNHQKDGNVPSITSASYKISLPQGFVTLTGTQPVSSSSTLRVFKVNSTGVATVVQSGGTQIYYSTDDMLTLDFN